MNTWDKDRLEDAVRDYFYAMKDLRCSNCPIKKSKCEREYDRYESCETAIIAYYEEHEEELG